MDEHLARSGLGWVDVLESEDIDGLAIFVHPPCAHGEFWTEMLADLEREWGIVVGEMLSGGTESFVAEARLENGREAVLKIITAGKDAARNEIKVLELARGGACARMLRSDVDRGAVLLERLGPSLFDLGLSIRRRHEILCTVGARLWRPARESALPTGAAKARWLAGFIVRLWEELDHPCSEAAVDYALACAETRARAHDDERAVLVHGDLHQWNTLQAGNGFKLVDPDGLLADPEYDLGIVMREDPEDLLHGDPWDRARWLAARTGLDAVATWEWGVVERVSTGLLGVKEGLQPASAQMLAVADRIVSEGYVQ